MFRTREGREGAALSSPGSSVTLEVGLYLPGAPSHPLTARLPASISSMLDCSCHGSTLDPEGTACSCPVVAEELSAQVTQQASAPRPTCCSPGGGEPVEWASRGPDGGGLQRAKDDSSREMQERKGLLKR